MVVCIFGPIAVDTMYQVESHDRIRTLRRDVTIGMDYKSVLALVEASGWPKERRMDFEDAKSLSQNAEPMESPVP